MLERLNAFSSQHSFGRRDARRVDEAVDAPNSCAAASTARCTSSSRVTSALTKRTLDRAGQPWPVPASSLTSMMTARPPAATIMSTVAPPRPDAPPVTRPFVLSGARRRFYQWKDGLQVRAEREHGPTVTSCRGGPGMSCGCKDMISYVYAQDTCFCDARGGQTTVVARTRRQPEASQSERRAR